ncbi:MAG: hypothetical protein ACFB0E_14590 [Leptolyngbyaceae cyanobacterium]
MSDADHAYQRRLGLIQRLSQLSSGQVLFALAVPSSLVPPATAKLGDRVQSGKCYVGPRGYVLLSGVFCAKAGPMQSL